MQLTRYVCPSGSPLASRFNALKIKKKLTSLAVALLDAARLADEAGSRDYALSLEHHYTEQEIVI